MEEHPGFLLLSVDGSGAAELFRNESGGHRWQGIPPNEKKGRIHTSTITVAILPEPEESTFRIDERDLDIRATRGSGAGGQARNKLASAIQLTHLPTGLIIRCESERSQQQNRRTALQLLRVRLQEREDATRRQGLNDVRRRQLGTGQRGDKIRTVREQDGVVTQHSTGRKMRLRDYLDGRIENLW